jgi:hypothetical protein
VDFYKFSIGANQYPLYIMAKDTVRLDPDKVVDGARFCVGQYITFQLSPLPSGVVESDPIWILGGNFVNQKIPKQFPDGSDHYTREASHLLQPKTWGWWTSGGYDSPEEYSACLSCTLVFPNGNPSESLSVSGLFSMHRPDLYYRQVSQDIQVTLGQVNGQWTIAVSPGFFMLAKIHSKFDGQAEAGTTQRLNGHSTNDDVNDNTYGAWWLDKWEFYEIKLSETRKYYRVPVISGAEGDITIPRNAVQVKDDPFIKCSGRTELIKRFEDYVRFCPNDSDSIFVTLAKVSWHVRAVAVRSGNIYTTEGPQIAHVDTGLNDSEEFPEWDHTDSQ